MNCVDREKDLLMLVHGQANGMQKLGIRFHVLFCKQCGTRLEDFYAMSQTLALKLENPRLGARPIARPPRLWATRAVLLALFLFVTTTAIVGSVAVWKRSQTPKVKCDLPPPPIYKVTPPKTSKELVPASNLRGRSCD